MTDPVARDGPRTEAGKRLRADLFPVEHGLVITQRELSDRIVAIEDEAAGVLPPDTLAPSSDAPHFPPLVDAVWHSVRDLEHWRTAGEFEDTLHSHGVCLSRTPATLEATSSTPEPPDVQPCPLCDGGGRVRWAGKGWEPAAPPPAAPGLREALTPEVVGRILDEAAWVPAHGWRQPVSVIVIASRLNAALAETPGEPAP